MPVFDPRRAAVPVLGSQMLGQGRQQHVPAFIVGGGGFVREKSHPYESGFVPVLLKELCDEAPPRLVVRAVSKVRSQGSATVIGW
jgi:hypothetical protein